MKKPAVLAALLLCLGLLAGCGSGSEGSSSTGQAQTETTEPTPQVVVEASSPGFDAASVYREASPGVVTIRSVFGGSAGAAEGSGFVLD
ncbi:MAG: hypothetical protein ACTHN7_04425, partial [Solirubrobacterales bacterium]